MKPPTTTSSFPSPRPPLPRTQAERAILKSLKEATSPRTRWISTCILLLVHRRTLDDSPPPARLVLRPSPVPAWPSAPAAPGLTTPARVKRASALQDGGFEDVWEVGWFAVTSAVIHRASTFPCLLGGWVHALRRLVVAVRNAVHATALGLDCKVVRPERKTNIVSPRFTLGLESKLATKAKGNRQMLVFHSTRNVYLVN